MFGSKKLVDRLSRVNLPRSFSTSIYTYTIYIYETSSSLELRRYRTGINNWNISMGRTLDPSDLYIYILGTAGSIDN